MKGETSPQMIRWIQIETLTYALALLHQGSYEGREAISRELDKLISLDIHLNHT